MTKQAELMWYNKYKELVIQLDYLFSAYPDRPIFKRISLSVQISKIRHLLDKHLVSYERID